MKGIWLIVVGNILYLASVVFGGNETHDDGTLDMVDYTQAIKGLTIDLGGKVGIKASDEITYDNKFINIKELDKKISAYKTE